MCLEVEENQRLVSISYVFQNSFFQESQVSYILYLELGHVIMAKWKPYPGGMDSLSMLWGKETFVPANQEGAWSGQANSIIYCLI